MKGRFFLAVGVQSPSTAKSPTLNGFRTIKFRLSFMRSMPDGTVIRSGQKLPQLIHGGKIAATGFPPQDIIRTA